jgi:hypothetical protein
MADSDLTVQILREIRDGIHTTNDKLDQTRTELSHRIDQTRTELGLRIDETNHRLDGTNHRLDGVESTLKDLAGQQLILTRYIGNVVDRQDKSIDDLRERVSKLESRAGEG